MKVGYCSDVHVEFAPIEIYNTEKADVLILAGDIIITDRLFDKNEKHYLDGREFKVSMSDRFHGFFQQVCEEFKDVIFILGNHESYHFDIAETYSYLKENLSYLKNLHILEKEKIVLNDVTFLAGTMWTNFNNYDSNAMAYIQWRMNDFRIIKNSNRKDDQRLTSVWSPEDAYKDHLEFMGFVNKELSDEDNKKVVMVTHHCPSSICVPEKYQGEVKMNPGYVSNLEDFILDNPKITHWVCGHSHRRLDAMIGSTNLVMNCRGYSGREELADNFELKYFNV
jgi:Icc-related predicted phosphoesterase